MKKHPTEQPEERKSSDAAKREEQEAVGKGSRIEGTKQQSDYDNAFQKSHARDKRPSELQLPAQGNEFRITGQHALKEQKGSKEKNDSADKKEKSVALENQSTQTENKSRTVSLAELETKAKSGDAFAQRFTERQKEIESAQPGAARDKLQEQLQRDIEVMFGRYEKSQDHKASGNDSAKENRQTIFSTGEITQLAKENPLAAAGSQMLESSADPQVRAGIKKDISEMLNATFNGPIEEAPNRVVEKQDGRIQLNINAVENISRTPAQNEGTAQISAATRASDWQSAMQRISELPLDKQMQIIGSGLQTFNESLSEQTKEGAIGGTIGVVQGVGNSLIGLANFAQFAGDTLVFTADIATNNPRYLQTADKVGESIGKTLVTGVRLFQLADAYGKSVEASGDYTKPFKDIDALGQELNRKWQALPPRERARVAAEFTTELGANLIPIGAATKLAKTEKLVTALEDVAVGVKGLNNLEAEEKYVASVSKLVDELESTAVMQKLEQEGISISNTAEKIPSKKPPKSINDITDERFSDSTPADPNKATEKYLPEEFEKILAKSEVAKVSETFRAEVANELTKLSKLEKLIMEKIGGPTLVTSMANATKSQDNLTALGGFSHGPLRLRLAEKVWISNEWIPNNNVAFTLRHELGHAINVLYKEFRRPFSDDETFRKVFKAEFEMLSEDMKYKLFSRFERIIDGKKDYNLVQVRDEVFADTYAHSRTGIEATNNYNLLMKQHFSKTIEHVKSAIEQIESTM
ncbi:MAG: hypothetical protein DKT66_07540 [Candidatus Melainabacteria bacterium]|nr:MAG: hypothetical protein DKT66_07540 [Candidatus Melainabacteria bacterium]